MIKSVTRSAGTLGARHPAHPEGHQPPPCTSSQAMLNYAEEAASGDSMGPEVFDDDRILVMSRAGVPPPVRPQVLWNGSSLLVKRVDTKREAWSPRLRLISVNPDCAPYSCLAEKAMSSARRCWYLVARVDPDQTLDSSRC